MVKITLPQYDRILPLQKGESLLELFQREGFFIPSDCAGVGTCGTCKIKLVEGDIPIQDAEIKLLSESQLQQGIRLSCRSFPSKNCTVEFFVSEETESDQILIEGKRQKIRIHPAVREQILQIEKPELTSNRFDFESINKQVKNGSPSRKIPLSFLRKIPQCLRENDYQVLLLYNDSHFIDIEPAHKKMDLYGLAVDIGTTTLVVKLIHLQTGIVEAVSTGLNPQQKMGADVISRIGYSQKNKKSLNRLQKILIDKLNGMIHSITARSGVAADHIVDITLVGNTVMGHLLLALDATNLATAPYTPVIKHYPLLMASEVGLAVHPRASVYLLPIIGRFVGGDTTGVMLAANVDQSDKMTLVVDIGTNGEIVLGNRNKRLATSTAAGPAFEGARIRFGMRASEGAIDRVDIQENRLLLHTVSNKRPVGICGSGIICLIGELLNNQMLTWTGQLVKDDTRKNAIYNRISEIDNEPIFFLHELDGDQIYLTQRDVREIQLAKSAIRTGIDLLMSELDVKNENLDRILLAGAFGNFINREQAIRIGLLPEVDLQKIRFVGNAACAGAELALLSSDMRERAFRIAEETHYVEMATHPNFYDQYTENMLFPMKT